MGATYSILRGLAARKCSVKELVADMSFYPPNPHDIFDEKSSDGNYGCTVMSYDVNNPILHFDNLHAFKLQVSKTSSIAVFHFASKNPRAALIYSHANACDIGNIAQLCYNICELLNVDVYSYDYEGYGESKGHLCEQALYNDVETVYKYVHNLWPTNIFIYGESIGSSPSCYIAANHPEGIVGLILHSALLSGVRLFTSNPLFRPCDPFDNYRIISKITVPIFQIHAIDDMTVPFWQAELLNDRIISPYEPWWVEDATHNTIEYEYGEEYYSRLNDFVSFVLKDIQEDQKTVSESPTVSMDPPQPVAESSEVLKHSIDSTEKESSSM